VTRQRIAADLPPVPEATVPQGAVAFRFPAAAIAVAGLALLVRLAVLFQTRELPFFRAPIGDGKAYLDWSSRIANGDWFGRAEGLFYQAPLYPYLLAILRSGFGFDAALLAVRLLQVALAALASGALVHLGERAHSRGAGLAAGLAMALYAPAIVLDVQLAKESLVVSLGVAVLGLLLAAGRAPRMGLFFRRRGCCWAFSRCCARVPCCSRSHSARGAGSPFVRPTNPRARALLPRPAQPGVRAGCWPGARGSSPRSDPVAVRNFAVGGELAFTTAQAGPNFYIGNHPGATGSYEPLRAARGDAQFERRDAIALAEEARGEKLSAKGVSAYWLGRGLDFWRSEPLAAAALLAKKLRLALQAPELADVEADWVYARASPVLHVLGKVSHFGVLAPLALLGLLWGWQGTFGRARALLLTWLGAAFAGLVLFYVLGRYRALLLPPLFLLAGLAIAQLAGCVRQRKWPSGTGRGIAFAASGLFFLLANGPGKVVSPPAPAEANLALAYALEGRFAEAERAYRLALTLDPEHFGAQLGLGNLLLVHGRPRRGPAPPRARRRAGSGGPRRAAPTRLGGCSCESVSPTSRRDRTQDLIAPRDRERSMTRRRHLLLELARRRSLPGAATALFLALLGIACTQTDPRPPLEPVGLPALSRLEPAVRTEIERRATRVEELLARATTPGHRARRRLRQPRPRPRRARASGRSRPLLCERRPARATRVHLALPSWSARAGVRRCRLGGDRTSGVRPGARDLPRRAARARRRGASSGSRGRLGDEPPARRTRPGARSRAWRSPGPSSPTPSWEEAMRPAPRLRSDAPCSSSPGATRLHGQLATALARAGDTVGSQAEQRLRGEGTVAVDDPLAATGRRRTARRRRAAQRGRAAVPRRRPRQRPRRLRGRGRRGTGRPREPGRPRFRARPQRPLAGGRRPVSRGPAPGSESCPRPLQSGGRRPAARRDGRSGRARARCRRGARALSRGARRRSRSRRRAAEPGQPAAPHEALFRSRGRVFRPSGARSGALRSGRRPRRLSRARAGLCRWARCGRTRPAGGAGQQQPVADPRPPPRRGAGRPGARRRRSPGDGPDCSRRRGDTSGRRNGGRWRSPRPAPSALPSPGRRPRSPPPRPRTSPPPRSPACAATSSATAAANRAATRRSTDLPRETGAGLQSRS
jgi:tetratricopeptide (TPR) repeat protein